MSSLDAPGNNLEHSRTARRRVCVVLKEREEGLEFQPVPTEEVVFKLCIRKD